MGIFRDGISIEKLRDIGRNTMVEHLGIELTSLTTNTLTGTMPVNERTRQPYGLLHGGASVALAETLGSIASSCCIDNTKQLCVGLEINANHVKAVREGIVTGTASPLHIGRRIHVWEIRIENEQKELVCISRLTVSILDKQ